MKHQRLNVTLILMSLALLAPISNTLGQQKTKASIYTFDQRLQTTNQLAGMPLSFTENQGQWSEQIKFQASAGGATMWFSSDGAYYQFTRVIKSEDDEQFSESVKHPDELLDGLPDRASDSLETLMIKASFVGANTNTQMIGVDLTEYKCNYFIGNDKSKWATNVPNYSAVLYQEIYAGIDLKYYGNGKQMEYDFIVSPRADFSQIKIQYEGAESIAVNANGELVVTTKWGEIIEQRPVVYQIENNSRVAIDGKYLLQDDNSFGFELSGYNPSLPLVIDPVLSYSTYLGGSSYDIGVAIAVDASGSTYVTGITYATDFPTLNAYQGANNGTDDVFVTKLSPAGNSLIYSTYLGGSTDDRGIGIAWMLLARHMWQDILVPQISRLQIRIREH